MTWNRLLRRSLTHYARANLALLMGCAVGTAVLTGALFVGDSIRGSLRTQSERRLAGVQHALLGARFVREKLATELSGSVVPAILLQGSAQIESRRIGKVSVLAVDARFGLGDQTPNDREAVLSYDLARRLDAKPGDRITVAVGKASAIPRSSALAKRDTVSTTRTLNLTVSRVLPSDHDRGQFSLMPGTAPPLNLMVSLKTVQQEIEQPERVNALLSPAQPLGPLQSELKSALTLADWGVKVHVPTKRKAYVSVESRRLILEPALVSACRIVAEELDCHSAPTYVYLANTIATETGQIPYSVVAAVDAPANSPLNPLGDQTPGPDEIVLVDWKDSPIKAEIGDMVSVSYFEPEVEGGVRETQRQFRLKAIVPLDGPTIDPDLVPEFPGITDKLSLSKWDPPFPYDNKRIQDRDEKYWRSYRTTPKAYISAETARQIWGSRFGDVTSFRLVPKKGTLDSGLPAVREALLKHLDAERGGLVFDDVRTRSLDAGKGSTDFGMLFLAFSFFLITAAVLLIALLFRLNLERRAREFGLWRSVGIALPRVRRVLLVEGMVIAGVGAVLGLALAVLYAGGLLKLMGKLWPTEGVESLLQLHVGPLSTVIGAASSLAIAAVAIQWGTRILRRIEPAALLKGSTPESVGASATPIRSVITVCVGFFGAGLCGFLAPFVPPGEPRAGTFFGCGACLLIAFLGLLSVGLRRRRPAPIRALAPLAFRNATRHPTRGLLTAGLVASAVFLLVAVESFRREPNAEFAGKFGGSGGFEYFAETDLPIHVDLNGEDGRSELLDNIERNLQRTDKAPAEIEEELATATAALRTMRVHPFRKRAGDDGSCLNLYQAGRPTLLGVPDSIVADNGFQFSSTLAVHADEKKNPWLLLTKPSDDGAIPALIEENSAVWMLKKGLGDIVETTDEEGRIVKLRLVGYFKDSVFQSELLISDVAFRKLYPRTEGFQWFLWESPVATTTAVREYLAQGAVPYGWMETPSIERVRTYLAVQNMYLTTFQLLGAFGLLLGIGGLAVVAVRNAWERRGETALLAGLGYRLGVLRRLMLRENLLLFGLGMLCGLVAAIASVMPHLAGGTPMPWGRLGIMVAVIFAAGFVVIIGVAYGRDRRSIIPSIRAE